MHIPTGRVDIESIRRLLLTDLQAAPKRDDFARLLDETGARFIKYRRWHG